MIRRLVVRCVLMNGRFTYGACNGEKVGKHLFTQNTLRTTLWRRKALETIAAVLSNVTQSVTLLYNVYFVSLTAALCLSSLPKINCI